MQTMLRILAVTLLALAVAGCHSATSAPPASSFELQAYRVPAAESKAVAQHLDAILASPGFLVGTDAHTAMRATQPFPGTVMVLAPASVQPSIASAIAEMTKAAGQPGQGTPATAPLRVHLWVVQAKAGSGGDSVALRPLASALDHLRPSLGPCHFVLADSAVLSVDAPSHEDPTKGNGMLVTSRGHKFVLRAVAMDAANVALKVGYSNVVANSNATFEQMNTTVSMRPGEYVVLAEAPSPEAVAHAKDATLMNLLVARVDRLTPTTR